MLSALSSSLSRSASKKRERKDLKCEPKVDRLNFCQPFLSFGSEKGLLCTIYSFKATTMFLMALEVCSPIKVFSFLSLFGALFVAIVLLRVFHE